MYPGAGNVYGYNSSSWAGTIILAGDISLRSDNGPATVLSGVIQGSGGLYLYEGTIRLNGSSGNTYTGVTGVDNGTLELNKSSSTAAISSNLIVAATGLGPSEVRWLNGSQVPFPTAVSIHQDGLISVGNFSEVFDSLELGRDTTRVRAGEAPRPRPYRCRHKADYSETGCLLWQRPVRPAPAPTRHRPGDARWSP